MTLHEIASAHFARGGKFVMGSDTELNIGEIVRLESEVFRGYMEHPFVVTAPATYQDAVENRPLECAMTQLPKDEQFLYFVEPGD